MAFVSDFLHNSGTTKSAYPVRCTVLLFYSGKTNKPFEGFLALSCFTFIFFDSSNIFKLLLYKNTTKTIADVAIPKPTSILCCQCLGTICMFVFLYLYLTFIYFQIITDRVHVCYSCFFSFLYSTLQTQLHVGVCHTFGLELI